MNRTLLKKASKLALDIIIGFFIFIALLFCLGWFHPALAYDPTAEDIQQAKLNWIDENGETPPDLTAEQEEYCLLYLKEQRNERP